MSKRTLNAPSALSQRIAARCIAMGLLSGAPSDYYLARIYAGHWMRARGAWSWELVNVSGRPTAIGSQFSATKVAVAAEWEISTDPGGTNIDPLGRI